MRKKKNKYTAFYHTVTAPNYPKNQGCLKVEWNDIFMPFDIIKGLDTCPPDNGDYKKMKKKHWWVCPKTQRDICNIHDVSVFIREIYAMGGKEFTSLETAVEYCINWRKKWLYVESKKIE